MSTIKQKFQETLNSTLMTTKKFSNKASPNQQSPQKSIQISKQIKDKFKTFTNWNYKQALYSERNSKKKKSLNRQQTLKSNDFAKALIGLSLKIKNQAEIKQKAKKKVVQQLVGIKAERRQRFKKAQNPLQFIKHYMQRENFKPTPQQTILIQKVIGLKTFVDSFGHNIDIQKVLKKIYKLMNQAVDYNQLRFLNLLILLAAQICFSNKDFNRAFYFYNQSRVASTYANIPGIKTQSLMGLGMIAFQLGLYREAMLIFKKNLQYAWNTKNIQAQLMIYDYIGESYYNQGNLIEAKYYHTRYIQGEIQNNDSAIKKISSQMLHDYNQVIYSLQQNNLTSLFIEYLNLPISNFQKVPLPENLNKTYSNYKNGTSPRKFRDNKRFDFKDFPQVNLQIERLLNQDYEFISQIPNPDMHRNFISQPKFGRKKKSFQFQQSSQFHRIIGTKPPKLNFQNIYKYPLDKRIQRVLQQKKDEFWWQKMLETTRKQRTQKVGALKERIRISHQSYQKYPEQRKRSYSIRHQKIKQSFNKTLLDWIDPLK